MTSSEKIPVGFGTIAGQLAAVAQVAGGIVLILLGKTQAEKEAGLALLGGGSLTQLATIAGRFVQAVHLQPVVDDLVKGLPTLAQELESPPVSRPETAVVPDGAAPAAAVAPAAAA